MKPSIFLIAFIFFITLVLIFSLVLPAYKKLLIVQTEIKAKEIELKDYENLLTKLNEISGQIESKKEELAKISSALPKDPSLPALFDFLQKLASTSGLSLGKINIEGSISIPEKPRLKETRFGIELSGKYPDFHNFLSALEKSARLIEVERILISQSEETKSNLITLTLKVYSY
jgi:Tfp pilus assembly protein PilO